MRITKFKVPKTRLLERPDIQAAIVRAWLAGKSQREIGAIWGYSNSTQICTAIKNFIVRFAPDLCELRNGKILPIHSYLNDHPTQNAWQALRNYEAQSLPTNVVHLKGGT